MHRASDGNPSSIWFAAAAGSRQRSLTCTCFPHELCIYIKLSARAAAVRGATMANWALLIALTASQWSCGLAFLSVHNIITARQCYVKRFEASAINAARCTSRLDLDHLLQTDTSPFRSTTKYIYMSEHSGRVTVVGSCNFDQFVYVPKLPVPGQTVYGTKYVTGFGGKGANQVHRVIIFLASYSWSYLNMAGGNGELNGRVCSHGGQSGRRRHWPP